MPSSTYASRAGPAPTPSPQSLSPAGSLLGSRRFPEPIFVSAQEPIFVSAQSPSLKIHTASPCVLPEPIVALPAPRLLHVPEHTVPPFTSHQRHAPEPIVAPAAPNSATGLARLRPARNAHAVRPIAPVPDAVVVRYLVTLIPGSSPLLISTQAFLNATAALRPSLSMGSFGATLSFADWGHCTLPPNPDGTGCPSIPLFPTAQQGVYTLRFDDSLDPAPISPPVLAVLDSGCASAVSAVMGADLAPYFAHSIDATPGAPVTGLSGVPLRTCGQALFDIVLRRAPAVSAPAPPRLVLAVRATAFPAIKSPLEACARFNLFSREALKFFKSACDGVVDFHVADKDYSGGLAHLVAGSRPPIPHVLNAASAAARASVPNGTIWYTDGSAPHEDIDGMLYSRLFVEGNTGYTILMRSASQDADTLAAQCSELLQWVRTNVPKQPLVREIISDFATEVAKQGRGDNFATGAVRRFEAAHPGTRILPLPPRSQQLNLAESQGWRHVHRGAAANLARAHLGHLGRSIAQRGATHQLNLTAALLRAGAVPTDAPRSRHEALLGIRPVASNTLGYCGQECYVPRADAKWSAFEDSGECGLYLHPSLATNGQLVLLLRNFNIVVAQSVRMSTDPYVHTASLARSLLFLPTGVYSSPPADTYSRALQELLVPTTGDPDHILVAHNPATGLPDHLVYQPEEPTPDPPPLPAPPNAADPWPAFRTLPGSTPIHFHPDAKSRSDGAPISASRARYILYRSAQTIDQYRSLHPGPAALRAADLKNDVKHRHVAPVAPVRSVYRRPDPDPVACLQQWRAAEALEGPQTPSSIDPAHALVAPAYSLRPQAAQLLAHLQRAIAEDNSIPVPDANSVPAAALEFASPGAPSSVREARERGDWEGPSGWKASMQREVDRIAVRHLAIRLVPAADRARAIREHGPAKVSTGYLVVVFRVKADSDGAPLTDGSDKKTRLAISDPNGHSAGVKTYSATIDEIHDRILATLGLALNLKSVTLDAKGAYLHGTRPTVPDGGRIVFAPVPTWAHLFGPYPKPGTPDWGRFLFVIPGNMPGLVEAGRVWFEFVVHWLVSDMGMTQNMVDLCVFSRCSGDSVLIVGLYVDDARLYYSDEATLATFHAAWDAKFGASAQFTPESEDYTGVRRRRTSADTVELSCRGVISHLAPLLAPYLPLPGDSAYPLPRDASLRRRDPSGPAAALRDDKVPEAQKLAGIVGFVATKVRADVAYGFVLLAPFIRVGALTDLAWRLLLRVANYLLVSIDLPLVLAVGGQLRHGLEIDDAPGAPHYSVYVDSSHGNAELGKSVGGLVMKGDGGANYWKVVTPERVSDSSGGAELITATIALKTTLGVNMLLSDLRRVGVLAAPPRPVVFLLDATAVTDDSHERLTKQNRWMATRKAMIRNALASGALALRKIPSADNVADILTKSLPGADFDRHRANILGHAFLHQGTLDLLPATLRSRIASGVAALLSRLRAVVAPS